MESIMRKSVWTTWRTSCYTHDVADHPASAGGVHHHQVRKVCGRWHARIVQVNGASVGYSTMTFLTDAEGEARWAMIAAARGGVE